MARLSKKCSQVSLLVAQFSFGDTRDALLGSETLSTNEHDPAT